MFMSAGIGQQSVGMAFGLGAAAMQAASYLFSRRFVVGRPHASMRLLVASQVLMGAVSLALIPLLWTPDTPPWPRFALPLAACTACFLGGQLLFFGLLRHAEASRASPLLGFKVVVLALLAPWFRAVPLNGGQWLAVTMATTATILLGLIGGRLDARGAVCLVGACVGYSFSDIYIARLVQALAPLPLVRAAMLGACLSYALAGLLLLGVSRVLHRVKLREDLLPAAPFAACWMVAMFLLYACFATVGPLFGNVLQSTRGILAIAFGAVAARLGHEQIESRKSPGLMLRRLLAAALMTAAVAAFALAGR